MLDVITRIQSAKSRLWVTLWTNNLVSSTNKLMGKKYSQHLRDNWRTGVLTGYVMILRLFVNFLDVIMII